MHRPACVQWSADCRLILSPFRPSPSPATRPQGDGGKGRRAGRAQRKKQGYKSLFPHVTSRHSARRRRAVDKHVCWPVRGGKHVLARTRPAGTQPQACLPAACTRPFGPSVHPSIHSSFPNSESAGQAQSSDQTHHSWLSSLGHSIHPRFQRAQTPIPECMYVDVSCLMFVSSLCLFLPSLGPKNRPLLSIFTHEPSSWHTAILDLSTF